MNSRKIISVVTVFGLIVLSGLWYGDNNGLLPIAASDEAALYDGLFNTLTALATGLFLLVEGALLFCVFRFRRREGDNTDGPPIRDNFTLELIWTALPTVIVMFVGIYSFDVYSAMQGNSPGAMLGMSHDRNKPVEIALDKSGTEATPFTTMSAAQTDLINVNVTAMQFAWIFSYPDYNNLETAELHLPVGSKVKLNMNASDVIHAFWVPQFRLKQDVIPGMPTQLQFTANKTGEYPIVCAELCGAYHGGMRAQLFVDTPEDFQAWVKTTQEELASNPTKRVIAANNLSQPTTAMSDREYLAGRAQSIEMVKGVDLTVLRSAHHMHDRMQDRVSDRTLSFSAPHS